MITVFFIVLTLLVAGIYSSKNILTPPDKAGDRDLSVSGLIKTIGILVLGIIISFVQPFSLERVDAGSSYKENLKSFDHFEKEGHIVIRL